MVHQPIESALAAVPFPSGWLPVFVEAADFVFTMARPRVGAQPCQNDLWASHVTVSQWSNSAPAHDHDERRDPAYRTDAGTQDRRTTGI